MTLRALEADGHRVALSSLDRILFPRTGFTKADLVRYVLEAAPVLLPHLVRRPVTLHRCPDGVNGPHFFQTRCPPHPPWVETVEMTVFRRSGKHVETAVIGGLASLVWAANLSTLELHPYLACVDDLDHPTSVVFDLDPGPPAGLREAAEVALQLRQHLDELGLVSFVKVSGGRGVHVTVPIRPGSTGYPETKAFARAVAAHLTRNDPDHVTDVMARSARAGKVYVDWPQNDAGRSTVAPYSLRAGAEIPLVAAPVRWEEVAEAVDRNRFEGLVVLPEDLRSRLERVGDPFDAVPGLCQELPRPD